MQRYTRPTTWRQDYQLLMPEEPNKDEKSRIGFFLDWLAMTGRSWFTPDLAMYRDYLLKDRVRVNPRTGESQPAVLNPSTTQAHLATIRGRYMQLLRDNEVRQMLFDQTPKDTSPADKKALVDEMLVRLQNAIHPTTAPVKVITLQDRADSEYLRLKPHQVKSLMRMPGIDSLPGIRDTAMIAMMVCTGVREAELVGLNVDDLRQTLNDEVALRVRDGKGHKQRLVPYGPLDWCLLYADRWMSAAKITYGPVFRGFYKGNKKVRRSRITTRAVNQILNRYPITIDGVLREVKPHDLRRTYARNAYEQNMDLERIRQNLGHASVQTTQTYIGELNVEQRRPPLLYTPPHNLKRLRERWMVDGDENSGDDD